MSESASLLNFVVMLVLCVQGDLVSWARSRKMMSHRLRKRKVNTLCRWLKREGACTQQRDQEERIEQAGNHR